MSVTPCITAPPTVAVIPAAGFGTRLRPLSNAIPKEMLPVGNRVTLEHIVLELKAAGMERIVLVLSPAKEALIRGYFGDQFEGVAFFYAFQPEMRGLGDAVLQAEALVPLDAPFVVALGDAVFDEPVCGGLTQRLLHATVGKTLGVAVQRVPEERISRYGVVAPAGPITSATQPFAISGIVEKPDPQNAPSPFAVAARYVLPFDIFAQLRNTTPDTKGEVQLTDALRALLSVRTPGVAVPLQPGETRHDIGNFDSYYKAFATFAQKDKELTA
jgi:UTP--glucose-1-phosphate uridylyltransferase